MKEKVRIVFTSKARRALKSMRKKYSEAELAIALNVTVCTIRRYISGEYVPPFKNRILIAKLYDKYQEGKL